MTTVNAASSNYIIEPSNVTPENDPLSLGSEDFMELMLVQIQNQNPMEPTDTTEYISQMAEFSSLEQMQSMNNSINTMYAFGMMGKEVTVNNGDGTVTTGLVDSVSMKNGTNYLEIDGVQYDALQVISASEAPTETVTPTPVEPTPDDETEDGNEDENTTEEVDA